MKELIVILSISLLSVFASAGVVITDGRSPGRDSESASQQTLTEDFEDLDAPAAGGLPGDLQGQSVYLYASLIFSNQFSEQEFDGAAGTSPTHDMNVENSQAGCQSTPASLWVVLLSLGLLLPRRRPGC